MAACGGRGRGRGGRGGHAYGNNPVTPEELMAQQMQMMQTMTQFVQTMQAGGLPHAQPPRDKRREFLQGHPPVFSHAADPMEADDWLCAVEKQLNIAQCNDQEKVLYASGQLQGAAQTWDPQGIAKKWDKILAVFMIVLAVVSNVVAVYSDAYKIFHKKSAPSNA